MKGMVIYTCVLLVGVAGYFFWLHEKGKREGSKLALREGSLVKQAADFLLEPKGGPEPLATTTRDEAWELARKTVAERMKGMRTLKFSSLSEKGSGCRDLGNGVWLARGYVEAQPNSGALQTTEWDAHIVTREGKLQLVALRLGKEQTGDPRIALDQAAPEERAALAAKVGAARLTLAEEKVRRRATFHRQARGAIEKWLASKSPLQHSTLPPQDDAHTSCRDLGNGIWEARGVMQTTGPKPERAPWRVLFSSLGDDAIHPRYLEIGQHRAGDEAAVFKMAGLATPAPRPAATPAPGR